MIKLDIKKIVFKDILIYFLLCVFLCLSSILLVSFYSYRVTQKQIQNTSEISVTKTYEHKQKELNQVLNLHSIWDQAYQNISVQYNQTWLDQNIGFDVTKSFGMDLAIVVNHEGKPLAGYRNGQKIEIGELSKENFVPTLSSYLMKKNLSESLSVLMRYQNRLYLASIGLILPSDKNANPNHSNTFLILGKVFTKSFINSFGLQDLAQDLRFVEDLSKDTSASSSVITYALKQDDNIEGYLVWTPAVSTIEFLKYLISITVVILFLLTLMAWYISRHLLNAAGTYDVMLNELISTTNNLTIAKQEIEEASEAKSKFLSTISHEIRTPMNGIVGMISLLRETNLDNKQISYLNTMQRSSDALMTMIDNILEFSNLQSSNYEIKYKPTNIRHMMANIQELLMPIAFQKNLEFNVRFSDEFPSQISIDEIRLRQLILQLTTNALKFTHAGLVKIEFNIAELSETHDELHVQVIDTGIGIADSIKDQLFKEFFQADSSITRSFDGSGLGLTIARGIVMALDGKIGLESKIGRGSIFWFTIPVPKEIEKEKNQKKLPNKNDNTNVDVIDSQEVV